MNWNKKTKAFTLVEVILATVVAFVMALSALIALSVSNNNDVKSMGNYLLVSNMENIAEDFMAIENGEIVSLEYKGSDLCDIWTKLKNSDEGNSCYMKFEDNGYNYSIKFFMKPEYKGVYTIVAYGEEEKLSLHYELEFSVKKFFD